MTEPEGIDARLSRLRDATLNVRPRADFTSRVMQGVKSRAVVSAWWSHVPSAARRFVPVAALAAVVAMAFAVNSVTTFDDAVASGDDDGTEVEW